MIPSRSPFTQIDVTMSLRGASRYLTIQHGLRCSPRTVERLVKKGLVKTVQLGGRGARHRIRRSELDRLATQKVQPTG